MSFVYPLLKTCVPCLDPVCELLAEHLYGPIKAGARLDMRVLRAGVRGGSLLEKIQEDTEVDEDDDDEVMVEDGKGDGADGEDMMDGDGEDGQDDGADDEDMMDGDGMDESEVADSTVGDGMEQAERVKT